MFKKRVPKITLKTPAFFLTKTKSSVVDRQNSQRLAYRKDSYIDAREPIFSEGEKMDNFCWVLSEAITPPKN